MTSLRLSVLTVALTLALSAHALVEPKTIHVALLGDSLAYGAGDESGRGLAGRLEPELRSRGISAIATTNFAVTGATTSDLLKQMTAPAARETLARADVVVLSAGANDLREMFLGGQPMRSPLVVAEQVLQSLENVVTQIRALNPDVRILILGAYSPVAHERAAVLLEPLVTIWDAALIARFVDDPLVHVVRLSDIINRPERLSRIDSFHPGGEAYQETAKRIAALIAD